MSSEGLLISAPPAPLQVIVKPPDGSNPVQVGTPSVLINTPVSTAEPSVTIFAPISKAEPLVTISTPISKAEPSVIISKPVCKAEPSATSSMIISKAEVPKLLTTVASERDTESSTFQQSKSISEPLDKNLMPALDRYSSMPPLVLLTQRTQPETSPSAPVTPIGDSASVLVGADGRKKESVRRSESLKEHQKKTSKKDARHSQQQHQITASDPAESTKVSPSKMVKDTSAADSVTHYVSGSTENIQAPSEIEMTKEMYRDIMKSPFNFDHCLNVLRHQPKWQAHTTYSERVKAKKMALAFDSSSTPDIIHLDEDNNSPSLSVYPKRPLGKKKEKELERNRKDKEISTSKNSEVFTLMQEEGKELHDEKMSSLKELIRLKKEKLEVERLKLENEVILMSTSELSEEQLQFIRYRRAEIMAKYATK